MAMWVWGARSSKPGEATRAKLRPRLRQAMSRRFATLRSISRPRTLTRMVSPMMDVPAAGEVGVEAEERGAGVVGGPPGAGDKAAVLGGGGGCR